MDNAAKSWHMGFLFKSRNSAPAARKAAANVCARDDTGETVRARSKELIRKRVELCPPSVPSSRYLCALDSGSAGNGAALIFLPDVRLSGSWPGVIHPVIGTASRTYPMSDGFSIIMRVR